MLPNITIDGRLTDDPNLRFTAAGKAVCQIRIAASDSRKTEAGEWETTERIFINASLWDAEAETAAEAYRKGDRVVATGRIYEREYDQQDGTKGKSLELKFASVGKIPSAPRGQQRAQAPTTVPPANGPWAAVANDQPPF